MLIISLSGPFAYFYITEQVPESSNYAYDIHLNFHESELKKNKNPDIVFFGTSRTMNNIRTDLINQEKINGFNTLNLGINWFGLGVQSHLINRWLAKKQPKIIVLEVPLLLRYAPHPHFSKLANTSEIVAGLKGAPIYGLKPSAYFSPRMLYQYLASELKFTQYDSYMNRENYAGFYKIDATKNELLETEKRMADLLARGQKTIAKSAQIKSDIRNNLYAHHNTFLAKIKKDCEINDVKLVLLPLPKLCLQKADPYLSDIYNHSKAVMLAPETLQRADYWRDATHMNLEGSTALTAWLMAELNKIINPK